MQTHVAFYLSLSTSDISFETIVGNKRNRAFEQCNFFITFLCMHFFLCVQVKHLFICNVKSLCCSMCWFFFALQFLIISFIYTISCRCCYFGFALAPHLQVQPNRDITVAKKILFASCFPGYDKSEIYENDALCIPAHTHIILFEERNHRAKYERR